LRGAGGSSSVARSDICSHFGNRLDDRRAIGRLQRSITGNWRTSIGLRGRQDSKQIQVLVYFLSFTSRRESPLGDAIMVTKITVATLAGLLVCLCAAAPAAYAQEKCTLRTLAGTYAIYEKGASSILDPSPSPLLLPFFAGATAPFVNVTELTFSPDGVGEGFFWIRIGALNGGLDPIPVHVTITEMNENCTGKLQYSVNLPGLSAAIEERIIVFDQGREFRSVPTSIQNGIDSLAWTGTGRRIGKPGEVVHSCGPHTASGTYLLTAENLVALTYTRPSPTHCSSEKSFH
jgi:hypothetical protein